MAMTVRMAYARVPANDSIGDVVSLLPAGLSRKPCYGCRVRAEGGMVNANDGASPFGSRDV